MRTQGYSLYTRTRGRKDICYI